jgi:hypothetical protein
MSDEKKINWVGWLMGIAATLVIAVMAWIGSILMFGFDEYVKGLASEATLEDSQTITKLKDDVTSIKTSLDAEAEKNAEFRRQQAEDMRNLIRIISDGN